MSRTTLRGLLFAAVAALFAAPAQASVDVGSSLPSSGKVAANGCNPVCTVIPTAVLGSNPVTSPIDGVIVRWGVYTTDEPGRSTVTLRVIAAAAGGKWQGIATGSTRITTVGNGNSFFDESPGLPIAVGQYVAVNSVRNDGSKNFSTIKAINGSSYERTMAPIPDGGAPVSAIPQSDGEAMIGGTVEPDADQDRFGDETQDQCVGTAGPNAGCLPPEPTPEPVVEPPVLAVVDVVRPVASSLVFAPPAFAAAGRGGSVARRRAPVGSTVSYSLSEAATLAFRVEARRSGRRVRGRCVRRTPANRLRPRCRRYVPLGGGFSQTGQAGPNRFRFTGRLRGRRLAPGAYRLVAVPTDAARNRGQAIRRAFRIVR